MCALERDGGTPTSTPRAMVRRATRGPVTVSFSGLDGAGKTQQIDALVASLGDGHTVEVLWVPFRIWPEPLLNRLPARYRSRLGPRRRTVSVGMPVDGADARGTSHNPSARPRDARRVVAGVARSMVWTGVGTFAAVSAGLSLSRRVRGVEADVLILDRYRLDSMVKLQYWYSEVSPRWIARVVEALTRAPDVEVFLRVEPAVAYRRKAEQWSLGQLARQARLYDQITEVMPHVAVVDAHEDPTVIAASVEMLVQGVLGER